VGLPCIWTDGIEGARVQRTMLAGYDHNGEIALYFGQC
jgi:hypothetical protein